MQIKHKQTGRKGMLYVEDDGDIKAEMIYAMRGEDTMIIEHTEVDDELRGHNIGYQLVNAAVEYARKHSMKIIPLCPFAKSVFDRKPEFKDVLAL